MGEGDRDQEKLDRLDYYALLAVDQSDSVDDVRRAFHRFASKYHPDAYVGRGAERIERATRITKGGAEAYRVLMDPEARSRYDAGLSQGRLRDTGQSMGPAPAAKPSVRPASLPAARAAQRAMQEGDLPTAKARLLEALSHDPRNVVLLRGLQEIEERMARGE